MTAAQLYAAIIQAQNEKHAEALDLNARLRVEVANLAGITLCQQRVDQALGQMGAS